MVFANFILLAFFTKTNV